MSISALPRILFRKWEHLLFWGIVVVLMATGLSWYRGLTEEDPFVRITKYPPRRGSLLNTETAFAFRSRPEETEVGDPHPFFAVPELDRGGAAGTTKSGALRRGPLLLGQAQGRGKDPLAANEIHPGEQTGSPEVEGAAVERGNGGPSGTPPSEQTGLTEAGTGATDETLGTDLLQGGDTTATEEKVMRVVEHRGVVGTPSGKQFALVQEVNTKQIAFVEAGSTLGDFRVESFGNDSLQVTGPDGKTHSIAFGSHKKIVIE